jgi:hypothetical protein
VSISTPAPGRHPALPLTGELIMHCNQRHDEILFRVLLDANPRMPRREVIERLGAMRRSSSTEIDLFVGVLDVD